MPRAPGLLVALLVLLAPAAAHGASISVTAGGDSLAGDGKCTLREAIMAANSNSAVGGCVSGAGADVVRIPALTVDLSRTGNADNANLTGDLDVTGTLTLRGAGAGTTTIHAHGIDRAIDVQPGASVTVRGLRVTGGVAPPGAAGPSQFEIEDADAVGGAGSAGGDGGGVRNRGTLTVADAAIVGNSAGAGGTGGTGAGGNCNTPENPCNGTPGGDGAGGAGGRGGHGGGVFSSGRLTIVRTRIAQNVSGAGGRGGDGIGGQGDDVNSGGQRGGDGSAGNAGSSGGGGGIRSDGALTVDASTIADNRTGAGGRGGDAAGGDGGNGVNNPSNGGHGGVGTGGRGGASGSGGGIDTPAAATIEDSLIAGNAVGLGGRSGNGAGGDGGDGVGTGEGGTGQFGSAREGGAGGAGGGIRGGALTLRRLLVTDNRAGVGGTGGNGTSGAPASPPPFIAAAGGFGGGGGAGGGGGGVSGSGSVADLTLHGNAAGAGGSGGTGGPGIGFTGANGTGGNGGPGGAFAKSAGTATIRRATITANAPGAAGAGGTGAGLPAGSAGAPGAATALSDAGGGTLLENSIVAESATDACAGAIDDGGNNFRFPANDCPAFTQNPQLGPLADNGGPTRTRALPSTSPAIDRTSCSSRDQRGVIRPARVSCDAGAYEFAPPTVAADAAIDIGADAASLRAGVNANARPTNVRFEYGRTLAYGSSTPSRPVPAGTSPATVVARIAGLEPRTAYHFRAVAVNADGSAVGPDGILTTGSRRSVRSAVRRDLAKAVAALRRAVRAERRRFTLVAHGTRPGAWTIVVAVPGARLSAARSVRIARARRTFARAGSKKVRVRFNRRGRRIVRSARKRIRLRTTVSFNPKVGRTVKRGRTITVRR